MPFRIIRNDITKERADVIFNTENPEPIVGSGTDIAIYIAAGKELLLTERKKIGHIQPGCTVSTPAFNLDAKYIIHYGLQLATKKRTRYLRCVHMDL